MYNETVSQPVREMTVEEAALAVVEAANGLAQVAGEYAKKATDFIDVRQRLANAEETLRERQAGLSATRERQGG